MQQCSNDRRTFAAFCKRSPDSPTQMLRTNFATRTSRMGFAAVSAILAAALPTLKALQRTGTKGKMMCIYRAFTALPARD
jgi:porphobilinogen deaminase